MADANDDNQKLEFERPTGSSHFNFTMASALISGGAFAFYKSRRYVVLDLFQHE